MIQILIVQGDVLVEDANNGHTHVARNGMTLDATGNYLITTTRTSRADIVVNGRLFKLEPSFFLRLRGDRTWWERHGYHWTDTKLLLGRIWARVARIAPDYTPGGGATGVRG